MRDVIEIASLADARVEAYRNLKDRDLAARSGGQRFIAEGEHVVRRLLASNFETESVFLAERRVAEIAPLVPASVSVYSAPNEIMHGVVGFKFHSGVLAVGKRGRRLAIADVVPSSDEEKTTLVVCPEIANTENLGGMIRIAAAFGAGAMVLGERSCDPFFRQSVRVSMGAVFSLPIVQSEDLLRDLGWLCRERGFELVATVVNDGTAEPLEEFSSSSRRARVAVLFGNEAQGLSDKHILACGRRLTIPMKLGTDSLNVAVAAGVILYQLTR